MQRTRPLRGRSGPREGQGFIAASESPSPHGPTGARSLLAPRAGVQQGCRGHKAWVVAGIHRRPVFPGERRGQNRLPDARADTCSVQLVLGRASEGACGWVPANWPSRQQGAQPALTACRDIGLGVTRVRRPSSHPGSSHTTPWDHPACARPDFTVVPGPVWFW